MTTVHSRLADRGDLRATWAQVGRNLARTGAARAALKGLEGALHAAERGPFPDALVPLLEASLRGQMLALAAERHALRAAQATVGRVASREPGGPPRTVAWLTRAVEALRSLVGTREALALLTRRIATLAPVPEPGRLSALLAERRRLAEATEEYRREFLTADERAWRIEGSAPPAVPSPEDDVVAVLDPVDGWHTWLDEIVDGAPPGSAPTTPEMSPESGPIGPLGDALLA